MADSRSRDAVIQNLRDAGCGCQCVEKFLSLGEEGKTGEQLKLLASHRKELLHRVHEEEKRIDCLDYLISQMKKEDLK